MPKAIVITGSPCSGKTTYALELMKTGEWSGIVSEDRICDKIMNIMNQKSYHDTGGAAQVKSVYWNRVNYNYLREQLLALAILKFGFGKNLIFEGYGLYTPADRQVLYNVLKLLGYTDAKLIGMPERKDHSNTEFLNHKVTSYEVTKKENIPSRGHPESFYMAWRKAVKRFGDL